MKKIIILMIFVGVISTNSIYGNNLFRDYVKSSNDLPKQELIAGTETTYINESSSDGDRLTRPRVFASVPGSANRTLWGTYDRDFQQINAVAGNTYTVTISNFDPNNSQSGNLRLELYKISGSEIAFINSVYGLLSIEFTATETTRYVVSIGDQNSDLNTGATLGDYTVSVASKGATQIPQLSSIILAATSVRGGSTVAGVVSISGSAPAGGAVVSLSSSNAIASVPATVLIPEGSTSAQFSVVTTRTNRTRTVTITGSYGGRSINNSLTVTR